MQLHVSVFYEENNTTLSTVSNSLLAIDRRQINVPNMDVTCQSIECKKNEEKSQIKYDVQF